MVGPPGLFFFLINSILHLFFGFSYDNFFDHLSVHDDYTSTPTTLQPTPKATQRVEAAMAAAAAAARDATRLEPLVSFFVFIIIYTNFLFRFI